MVVLTYDEIGVSHHRKRKRRICKIEGCGTVLNSYNKTPFCSKHQSRNLLVKETRRINKAFKKKCEKFFQLSTWEEEIAELDNLGLGYRFRRIKIKNLGSKKMYAVFVKD